MENTRESVETFRDVVKNYGVAVFAAIFIALVIRFFVIEAYRIPSTSMKPTLEAGDTIFVAKWPFGLRLPGSETAFTGGRMPRRGEVVVYSLPEDSSRDYIKRVIALPGDTVEMRGGKIVLNGKETWLPRDKNMVCGDEVIEDHRFATCTEPPVLEDYGPAKVPAGSVFVLGDLRTLTPELKAHPSWGNVPISLLKGQALWIWLSIEPPGSGRSAGWFSRIRFERMGAVVR